MILFKKSGRTGLHRKDQASKTLFVHITLSTTHLPSMRNCQPLFHYIHVLVVIFFMKALHEPLSYPRCFFKLGVILHGVRKAEGSVRCTDLTLFCRFYLQPSGLLQGQYLHPNSANYLSTCMV